MKLWLVRHPQPLVAAGTCYGVTDLAADAQATARQAQALADLLPAALPLFVSPLQRCQVLAQALQTLRADLAGQADARLRELDFGSWEMRPWAEIEAREMDAWMADFGGHRVGGGESAQALLRRVGAALGDTRRHCELTGAREAVWITHAGVIRAATLWAGGVTELREAGQWPRQAPGYGEWVVWEVGD